MKTKNSIVQNKNCYCYYCYRLLLFLIWLTTIY